MVRTCLDCGEPTTRGARCAEHTREKDRELWRRKRAVRPLPYEVRKERKRAVEEWVQTYGHVCPGWKREPHPSTDLTADHVVPFKATGSEDTPMIVLCRSCNGRKGASVPPGYL